MQHPSASSRAPLQNGVPAPARRGVPASASRRNPFAGATSCTSRWACGRFVPARSTAPWRRLLEALGARRGARARDVATVEEIDARSLGAACDGTEGKLSRTASPAGRRQAQFLHSSGLRFVGLDELRTSPSDRGLSARAQAVGAQAGELSVASSRAYGTTSCLVAAGTSGAGTARGRRSRIQERLFAAASGLSRVDPTRPTRVRRLVDPSWWTTRAIRPKRATASLRVRRRCLRAHGASTPVPRGGAPPYTVESTSASCARRPPATRYPSSRRCSTATRRAFTYPRARPGASGEKLATIEHRLLHVATRRREGRPRVAAATRIAAARRHMPLPTPRGGGEGRGRTALVHSLLSLCTRSPGRLMTTTTHRPSGHAHATGAAAREGVSHDDASLAHVRRRTPAGAPDNAARRDVRGSSQSPGPDREPTAARTRA